MKLRMNGAPAGRRRLLRAGSGSRVFPSLTLVAPFADEVEAALEERIVVGRRGSGEGEDGGGEGRGGFGGLVLGVGFGWVGWDRGENEVVGVGELPGVVGGGAMK